MRNYAPFALGAAVAVLLAAAAPQEAPRRFHGFSLAGTESAWVVVDGDTGDSCQFTNETLDGDFAETIMAEIAEARQDGSPDTDTQYLRHILNRADCRTSR